MMTHDDGIPSASAEGAWRATRDETVHHDARHERFSAQKKAEVV